MGEAAVPEFRTRLSRCLNVAATAVVALTAAHLACAADAPKPPSQSEPTGLIVDAMVGQVNGKPIYANEVIERIGEEQLRRLGTSLPRLGFQQEAFKLVDAELRSHVQNEMLLAEAERNLTEQEQLGLASLKQKRREELLAKYGGGVLAEAERNIQKEEGHTLEVELERWRQKVIVDKFMRDEIQPKIHVNRREVERYYRNHEKEFNPTPSVTVRVIIVTDPNVADEVDAALNAGKPFADVAKEYSRFRADKGGLMDTFKLEGPMNEFSALAWKEMNEKVRTLKAGQHSDRTKIAPGFGWAMVDSLEQGEAKGLQEVFIDIENRIRGNKFRLEQNKYLVELLRNGNYTSVELMLRGIMDVVMTRYAQPSSAQ
ncbi:MAG: hypothetical protein GC159_15470 [Phycisphaera sp.]|nr:hypothetical protein [Phycisphaera sp.]